MKRIIILLLAIMLIGTVKAMTIDSDFAITDDKDNYKLNFYISYDGSSYATSVVSGWKTNIIKITDYRYKWSLDFTTPAILNSKAVCILINITSSKVVWINNTGFKTGDVSFDFSDVPSPFSLVQVANGIKICKNLANGEKVVIDPYITSNPSENKIAGGLVKHNNILFVFFKNATKMAWWNITAKSEIPNATITAGNVFAIPNITGATIVSSSTVQYNFTANLSFEKPVIYPAGIPDYITDYEYFDNDMWVAGSYSYTRIANESSGWVWKQLGTDTTIEKWARMLSNNNTNYNLSVFVPHRTARPIIEWRMKNGTGVWESYNVTSGTVQTVSIDACSLNGTKYVFYSTQTGDGGATLGRLNWTRNTTTGWSTPATLFNANELINQSVREIYCYPAEKNSTMYIFFYTINDTTNVVNLSFYQINYTLGTETFTDAVMLETQLVNWAGGGTRQSFTTAVVNNTFYSAQNALKVGGSVFDIILFNASIPVSDMQLTGGGGVVSGSVTMYLNLPENTTYYGNQTTYNFNFTNTVATKMSCNYTIDSTVVNLGMINNNTAATGTLRDLSNGFHKFWVSCNDTVSVTNVTANVNFTMIYYTLNDITYKSIEYETNLTNITISFLHGNNLRNISGYLNYTNTTYTLSFVDNGALIIGNVSFYAPLLLSNNTNKMFFWNISLNYYNGTKIGILSNQSNQTLVYSYWLDSITNTSVTSEGQTVTIYIAVSKLFDSGTFAVNLTFNNTIYPASIYTTNSSYDIWRASFLMPNITTSTTKRYNATLYSTYGGITRSNISLTYLLTISPMSLSNCADGIGSLRAFNFSFYNEEDVNAEMNATGYVSIAMWTANNSKYVKNQSFSFGAVHNFSICIFPNSASYIINATIYYWNQTDKIDDRFFYLVNYNINNETQLVNGDGKLYLINQSNFISLTFKDSAQSVISNAIVKALRWYEGNVYRIVAMGETDSNGKTNMRLRMSSSAAPTVKYMFIIERDGIQIASYGSQIIDSTAMTLSAVVVPYYDWISRQRRVKYSCDYTASTKVFRCQVTEVGISTATFRLVVKKKTLLRTTIVTDAVTGLPCDLMENNTNTYMSCNLGNTANASYMFTLYAIYPPTYSNLATIDIIVSDELDFKEKVNYGVMGLFTAFMLIITMFFLGSYNPTVAILFSIVGLIASVAMQLISVGESAVIGIIVVGLFIMYKARS